MQKRLPTEAEWEFAALGNSNDKEILLTPDHSLNEAFKSNTFQGSFPTIDTGEDGYIGVSPVASFPSNQFGLYDMIGNVWEWTSDWYDEKYFKALAKENRIAINPQGPNKSYDSTDPYSSKRVTKGGSFLCSEKYCSNYRTSARQGSEVSSGSSNIGFRCVKN
jgi:formylglycine-generating enzyme